MPKGKSSLFAKIAGKVGKAVAAHAKDETTFGRVNLPPGINNGVAKLTKCYFDKYKSGKNVGELYCRMEGIVVKPTSVDTKDGPMKVKGLSTSVMIGLCESTNGKGETTTVDDCVARLLNEWRRLAGDEFTADSAELEGEDATNWLEGAAESLQEMGPHFRFTTDVRKALKKGDVDGVWENWHGKIDDFDEDGDTGVEEEEETPVEKADVEEEEIPKASKNGKLAKKPTKPEPDEEEEEEEDGDAEDSDETDPLDTLAESADEGDKEANRELTKIAKQNGFTAEQIENDYNSWVHLVTAIKKKAMKKDEPEEDEEEEETADDEVEPYVPKKDDIVKYKGPKDKKAMEYEVTAVYKKSSKCDLKQLDDGKTVHKLVPFDKVSESPQ